VCQDFAHLMLAALRSLGLPARYVSGYLLTRPPEGRERLVGADVSHAWVSLWVPGAGWIDLDPTNDLIPEDAHITLAWGRDYGDVSPIVGLVYGGGEQTLDVAVDVAPVREVETTADMFWSPDDARLRP
jgi:transglutaminase-like putative cysteine protease